MELDHFGASRHQGQPGGPNERLYVWGYDEITLFAHQTKEYRAKWLQYAWDWLQETDTNAHLQMPGSRILSPGTPDGPRWYWANTRSDACPEGSNTEETIKELWKTDHEFLAGLIFVFSVTFPLLKFLISLICASGTAWSGSPTRWRCGGSRARTCG